MDFHAPTFDGKSSRVLSYVDKQPPKPMDKPENEFITKKLLGAAAAAHGFIDCAKTS